MKKLNNTYRLLLTLVVMFVLGASIPAKAELTCPDAGLLSGKLLTDVCWSCIFPIRVAGLPLGSGSVPSGASNKSFCLCEDNLGVPRPGIVTSMWEPARLIELVRTPGCSPSLGGIRLPLGDRRLQGGHGEGEYDTAMILLSTITIITPFRYWSCSIYSWMAIAMPMVTWTLT